MSKKYQPLLITHYMSTWVTITEAVEITTKAIKQKITPSDIYRHALSGNILLSVYFQSPVILKKIQTFNGKIKFRQFVGDLLDKLCMLDRDGFIYGQNLKEEPPASEERVAARESLPKPTSMFSRPAPGPEISQ
ncbi:hypothetical protein ESCOCK383M_21695 [Escherichia coli]